MTDIDVSVDVHGIKGPAVDVGSIERELAQLWRMPTVIGLRETDVVPTRTSVLNLVVHCSDPALEAHASKIINELATNHPSRVISFTVTSDPRAFEDDIDAHVSTHCYTASGERFASCYEKIEIKTPPDSLDQLPSIVVALALPDLPTFVWWPGQPPLADKRFVRLAHAANRIVLDSLDFQRCGTNLIRVHDLCRVMGERCALSDLNWARLTPWRSMVSQLFDIPDCRWALDKISKVRLVFGHHSAGRVNAAQAMLFAGWLTSRLGWRLVKDAVPTDQTGVCFARDMHGGRIHIELQPRSVPRDYNGYLLGVSLTSHDGEKSGQFDVERIGDDLSTLKMTAALNGNVIAEHAMRSALTSPSQLLLRELETTMHDDLFEDALAEGSRLASVVKLRRSA
jgi:glucose-6-phosphate dehydrogenase assembly protein OpcA